jgi:hypothetical protein
MEKIVKGMIQVAGTTYRIVRLKRGQYNVVRVLDDVVVGGFTSAPQIEIQPAEGTDATLMLEIARVAIQGAKTSWVGRALLG